jgi:5'(3')-deoxyribonucleotidase
MDGVLYDFTGEALFLLREYRNVILLPSVWFTAELVGKPDWNWLWDQRDLFRDGKMISGAKKGMIELDRIAHPLIITSRPRRTTADTYLWLSLHRMPVYEVHIIGGQQRKSQITWDILIDDRDSNIADAIEAGRRAIIFEQPWNANYQPDSPLVKRARDWGEVIRRVTEHAFELTAELAAKERHG